MSDPMDERLLASCNVAVVVPAYKVEQQIVSVLESIPAYVRHVVVVNDASPDSTGEEIRSCARADPRIVVVNHTRNQGVGGAMLSGIRKALELGAWIVVKVDGDGQMPPDRIRDLLGPLVAGKADMTKGNRFRDFEALRQMPLLRRMGNACLSFLVKAATGYWNIFDPANGFVALRADLLRRLPLDRIAKSYFFEVSLLGNLYLLDAVVEDVEIPSRYGTETSRMSITRVVLEFPPRLLGLFLRRVALKYAVYDFSMGSVYLLTGLPLLTFGLIFGIAKWYRYSHIGVPAPTGTVMLATLTVILGVQFLLSAIAVDLSAVPHVPTTAPLDTSS